MKNKSEFINIDIYLANFYNNDTYTDGYIKFVHNLISDLSTIVGDIETYCKTIESIDKQLKEGKSAETGQPLETEEIFMLNKERKSNISMGKSGLSFLFLKNLHQFLFVYLIYFVVR